MRIIIIAIMLLNLHFGLLAQNEPTLDIVPNPFVDTTSFIFTLPIGDTVSIVVYDRWGQLIDSVIKEQLMPQGIHSVIFVGDTLPEDVYVVALIVDANVVGKNLIKLDQLVGFKNDKLEEQLITIYPNPTTGQITVTGLPEEATRITVYNALGSLIYDLQLNSLPAVQAGPSETVIDLDAFPHGIYLLQLESEGSTIKKRVVKN